MEIVIQIIIVMVILELFELHIQKSDTLAELISKLYGYYRQSVFIFFMIHPSLYFVLGVLLYFDAFNFFGITILVLKTFDVFFKIEMIKQSYFSTDMDPELEKMMSMKLTPTMRFLGLIVYVPLLFMAISSIFE